MTVFFTLRSHLFIILLFIAIICLFHLGRCAFCSPWIFALMDGVSIRGVMLEIKGLIWLWCRRDDAWSNQAYFSRKGLLWIYHRLVVMCSCWILLKEAIRNCWSLVLVFWMKKYCFYSITVCYDWYLFAAPYFQKCIVNFLRKEGCIGICIWRYGSISPSFI